MDLDSDGDGCDDVIEAGFTDADGDGVPGDGAPTVGTDGKITGHSYADPQDTNSNNVDDFLETSYDAGIYTHPISVFVDEEDDTIFVSQATLQTRFTFWSKNEPNNNYDYAYMNSNNLQNSGWMDQPGTSTMRSVVEFDSLTQETISGLTYMFQHRGHSYYYRNSNSTFDDAVTFAQNAGGYLVVINDTYEAELVRENVRKQNSNVNFWVNHYRDPNADDYVQSTYSTGWVSGYIPNADITYQWQVGVISGSDTTWTDVTNGTNYAGADNDTLRVKAIPASFDKNLYRLKASSKGNACTAGPAYSDPAQLTVSSDPDGDGIKNSVDLDDDNDGILDTEEGGKTLDTDGDGIPNRLDLDSDGDGCLDAEEAGFTGFDSDGRLCADSNCADSNGKVTGHSYADPLDGDSSGTDDYLEFGQSPTITSDLNNQVIIANGSSTTLTVNTTIAGINSPALSYTNWRSGEPNNSNTQNYAYARIGDGLWDDRNNGFAYHWEVVEFNTPRNDAISGYTKLMDDYNGHSYYVRDSYQSYWTNARNSAKNIGGYLVVIDSEVEKDLVHDAVRAKKGSSWNYWIGLYQNTSSDNFSEPSGGWEWVDQPSTISYTWQVSSDNGSSWTTINAENDTANFFVPSGSVSGDNLFKNGSLVGTVDNARAPDDWIIYKNQYGDFLTPDVNNFAKPAVAGIYSLIDNTNFSSSDDGGTWTGFHDKVNIGRGFGEGIWQSGVLLEAGKTYIINFEQANFGAIGASNYNNDGKINVFIQANNGEQPVSMINTGTTEDAVLFDLSISNGSGQNGWEEDNTYFAGDGGEMVLGTGWNDASIYYTAPTTGDYSILFNAYTTSVNQSNGEGVASGAYLSIDGISIQEANGTTLTSAYTGYGSNSLTVNPVSDDLDGYQYRVIASNPGFKCAVADTSNITTLVVRDDFDGDGIRDDVDVDDDNDGILDQYEGNGSVDTDGDGMPNTKDLDSDGDGCYDVDEAYGTTTDRDPNDDGVLGGANPTINSNGSVNGYNNNQLDQDGNGVKDFLEAGSAITDMSCPEDVTVAEGSPFSLVSTATGMGETGVSYMWQVSADTGKTWTNVTQQNINENKPKIMISGIGYGKTSTSSDGYPKFIEIYALEDANLSQYRLYDNLSGNYTNLYGWGFINLSIQMKKGERLLLYYSKSDADTFFGSDINELYDHTYSSSYLYITMQGGDDNFTLWHPTYGYFDRVGPYGNSSLNYDDGWLYRKSGSLPKLNVDPDEWTVCKDCLESTTNATAGTPFPLKTFTSGYTGGFDFVYDADSLEISDTPASLNGYQFRSIGSTPGFVCGESDTSCVVTVTVVGDFDRDGIPDATDLDDDNDGILDSIEGENTDTDGDGIPDKFDLDSDGDGCKDVQEAGFSDPDGDGIFGSGTPTVGTDGKLVGHDYATPADADGNGTADHLEVGSTVTINSYNNYFLSEGNDTAQYYVNYSVTGTTKLHWQVSTDNGTSWADINAGDNGTATSGDTEVCTNSNWGSDPWNWTEGSLENTLTNISTGTDMTIKVNQNTDVEWDAGYPKIETSAFGGVKTLGLSVNPKSGSGESAMTTTITFSKAVNGISMLVTDIDSKTDGWKDKVVITSDAGNPSADSLNTNPAFSIDGNTLTAKENIESNGDNLGTARLTFPDGVKTITIVYSDVSGIDDPDSRGIGFTFENICVNTGSASYEGVYNDTLNIYDIRQGMDEWKYRLRIATPAYVCQDTVFSQPARLDVVSDFDNDGVLNSVDLDDDNDGILDTDEGEGDLDGDGIKNRFDLDSDGDGCYDVTEAGFTDKILDANADGILGDNQPYTVDSLGRITSGLLNDGYSTPNDLDENGQMDFLQFGQNILNAVLNSSSLQMLASGTGSFKITASVPTNDKILFQWQESRDGGTSWFNVPETAPYSGTTTTELTLTQPDVSLTGYKYRVLLTIPSYVCAVMPLNLNADLTVYPDNDKDGVRDSQDQDDDNDGILDSYEGNGDNDQDGIPNRFDTDADGDGCDDVLEAGYLDANGDGLIGPDTVTTMFIDSLNSLGSKAVSSSGRVNSFGGYGVPADLDGNGIYDFLEEGAPITAVECPDSVTVAEGGNAIFSGNATVESGTVKYQWEISKDSGTTWSNISESGLMFVGLGQGYYYSNDAGRPKFIELMATKDIDNLSEYRLINYPDGNNPQWYSTASLSGSIKKGQMILLYYDATAFNQYFNTNYSTGYARYFAVGDFLRYGLRDGDDAFTILWNKADGNNSFNNDTDIVDMVGVKGEDGTGKDWEYRRGWIKRKNNKAPKSTFDVNDWTVCEDCLGTEGRNVNASTPYVLRTYSTNSAGSGSTTNTLTLKNVTYDDYHGALVRVKVSTPAYACGEADTSCVARISVTPIDSDGDGVADRFDSDDDNDGILDEDEGGEDADTDGDGIPNRLRRRL